MDNLHAAGSFFYAFFSEVRNFERCRCIAGRRDDPSTIGGHQLCVISGTDSGVEEDGKPGNENPGAKTARTGAWL